MYDKPKDVNHNPTVKASIFQQLYLQWTLNNPATLILLSKS